MAKVIIYLRDHEATALNDLAQREYRAPKAQAALIIRKELERLGMIPFHGKEKLSGVDSAASVEMECAS